MRIFYSIIVINVMEVQYPISSIISFSQAEFRIFIRGFGPLKSALNCVVFAPRLGSLVTLLPANAITAHPPILIWQSLLE